MAESKEKSNNNDKPIGKKLNHKNVIRIRMRTLTERKKKALKQ